MMIQDNIIEGNPIKGFFIEMITRDISIKDAILDLLDNSIDGANAINPNSYTGLYINITINEKEFVVKDNCGGFSLEIAKRYAFRFGRPEEEISPNGTVGRFGIGMKRALFKMGKNFEVETRTDRDHFLVKVDVEEWRDKTKTIIQEGHQITIDDWNFTYEELISDNNLSERGTYIKVTNLYKEVSNLFEDNIFKNSLRNEIEKLLNLSLIKGIKITLNGEVLRGKNIEILKGDSQPYFYEGERDGVRFRIIAGLGKIGDPSLSGWYIYCNDRLVLEADKTEMTGWGVPNVPKFHLSHVMFRGVVLLDAEETIKLPLTTTKRGIDTTSDIYKVIFPFMKEATFSIVQFLKEVAKLGEDANNYRELLVEKEEKISVVEMKTTHIDIEEQRKFIYPEIDLEKIAQGTDKVRISYEVSKDLANKVRIYSNTKSLKDLGIMTFNYYLKMEEIDNE